MIRRSHVCRPLAAHGAALIAKFWAAISPGGCRLALWFAVWAALSRPAPIRADILWSDLGATLVRETGTGNDIIGGVLKRTNSSADTLYFKFHVDPLSDASTEEYFAAFELYEGGAERLALGNALKAWAYSAFNTDETGQSNKVAGYIDLNSANPEASGVGTFFAYELPHRGIEITIVFKVQYIPGGKDQVTVWLNPDLGPGATEAGQPASLTTSFRADASFDEIRLRHGGGGEGWTFSEMAIATSFSDFVNGESAKAGVAGRDLGRAELPFTFRSWQREQGLPQNFVRALAQTRDGYIWVGSDDGVSRFDGVRFASFGLPEGLQSGPVQTLYGDSGGALWIGSVGDGLSRWQDGRFARFTTRDGLPSDSITALAEDGAGRLWIGTDAGLVVWQDGKLTALPAAEAFKGKPITALFKDRKGTMWLGAAGAGVFYFQSGAFLQLRDASVDELLRDPHCLLVDQDGRIWVGAGDDFVLCHEEQQWRRYRIPRHLPRHYVSALAEEPDGTVWAGSVSEGLFQFKGGKLGAINAGGGLSDNLVESLLVDQEGKLWVGTHGGLNRLQPRNVSVLSNNEGIAYGAVQGLAEIEPGVVWAGTPSDGLYRWDGKNFNPLIVADVSPRDLHINALLMARDGGCWVARARGLFHFPDPKSVAGQVEPVALPDLAVLSLAQDADGGVWAGTREGELWCFSRGQWLADTNRSYAHALTAIVADADGSLWVGTGGEGLYHLKGTELLGHWDKGNGLLSELIRTLYQDGQGTLWIGTVGGGLSRLRGGKIVTFTMHEGLPDNSISQILEDDSGNLWLGGNRGIFCVAKRDLDGLETHKIPTVYPRVYGRAEGMLSEECTGGFSPAGLKTRSGRLWFSTLKGVVVVDPRHPMTVAPAPRVVLEEALVDGVLRPGFQTPGAVGPVAEAGPGDGEPRPQTLRIPPGRHRIEFRYTGLSFDAPERVRFRYRLEGLDPDWVDAGTRRLAFYSYVPPGKYQFRVMACNADGVWSEHGALLGLTVLPHFWQTWWFLGSAAFGLLVSIGGGSRIVVRKRVQHRLRHLEQERARLEQERMLERERTRIAQDLHDEMGARLCRISFLSEDARRSQDLTGELRHQINSISDASRQMLHSLDEIVWAVNPQNDTLEHVASYIGQYAPEYFQETGIECEVDIPAQLPARFVSSQIRHHLLLAVHEALTNVLKHSAATRVRVWITCSSAVFEITVSDDGVGFDANADAPRPKGAAAGSGNGLRNLRRRLADIGGEYQVNSRPGGGTTIRFSLPLREPAPTS